MSQNKIDQRKQNKAEMLHNAKKQMKITTAVIAVILIVLGVLASVATYHKGYNVGKKAGEQNASLLYDLLKGSQTEASTEGEAESGSEGESGTASEEDTEASTDAENETEASTEAEDETVADSETE